MTFPGNYTRVWVRGYFVDLGKAVRGESAIGLTKPVIFTASPTALRNPGSRQIFSTGSFQVVPNANDGYFQAELPSTDDPDVSPLGWTYRVEEPTGLKYDLVVPHTTPVLDSPGDPLHGQRVIEIVTVQPAIASNAGVVQLIPAHVLVPATALVDAATIMINANVNRVFKVTIQGNRTLDNPVGSFDGQTLIVIVEQGAPGGFVPVLGSKYRLPAGRTLTWSSIVGRKDRIMLQYDLDDDRFDVIAFQPGY